MKAENIFLTFTVTHSYRKETTGKHFRDKAKVQKCMCTHEVFYIIIVSIKYIPHLDGIPRLLHNQLFFLNTETLRHLSKANSYTWSSIIVKTTDYSSYLIQPYTDIYLFKNIYMATQLTLSELQWLLHQLNLFLLTPKFQEHP